MSPRKERSRQQRHEQRHRRGQRHEHGEHPGSHDRHHPARRQVHFRKLKASVDKNHKGFAFLIFEDRKTEDAFVNPREAARLFHGDRVEAVLDGQGEPVEIKVLEHRFHAITGRFTPMPSFHQGRSGWVTYERKRAREEVFIPSLGTSRPDPNDWVRAKLMYHAHGPHPVTAIIEEVYGPELPASADVGMIAAEYGLIEEHPPAAVSEAEAFELDLSLKGRTDLREVPFITIDGETARDFDDAVYVERKKSGYLLWVAIADVSHYVTPGTVLDRDARSRGTSVYFPERAFHMLPRALSENLCSLKPDEPRLALTAKMSFDRNGKRTGVELMASVIESKRRATYNQIQGEYEQNERNSKWEYAAHFELYRLIRKTREDRGSIDFDLPEAEVVVDPAGEPVSITKRERLDSHRLIEEFMISANEAVTDWIMEKKLPFIYRIHEEPAEEALSKFEKLAATVGVRISLTDPNLTLVLADFIRRIENHPAQDLLNMALLRSMKQARYSAIHDIHFGLASPAYTHFTSPIRRYPDLAVHRQLHSALRQRGGMRGQERTALQEQLEEIAEHCSYRERVAADADREATRLKQVRAMRARLGDEFEARVVGMAEPGLFVELDDPYVEGLVGRDSFTDDFYQFNEERMIFFGRRKRRTFRIGDRVRVRAVRADLDRRQIDFGFIEGPVKTAVLRARSNPEIL